MATGGAGQVMQVDVSKLMPPPPPRPPKRKVVLEESAYTDAIEAIIERDFFPDVPKLQNQLDWLQAIQSGDPAKIRQAQQLIARRRAGLDPHAAAGPPASMLPSLGRTALATPAMTPLAAQLTPGQPQQQQAPAAEAPRAPALSLDAFCSQYTSEDNASFAQLQEKTLERKRARVAHHLQDKNQPLLLTGPRSTDEYGTSGQQPGTLVDVKHAPKNRLYYDNAQQPSLELSEKEQLAIVQGPPKAISHTATRLPGDSAAASDDPAAAVQQLAAAAEAASAAAAASHGTKGYGYMRTPNLAPGVEASPIMTWGTIASTPLRLDVDADLHAAFTTSIPADATPGPQFKLPEQRQREVAAMQYINKRVASAAAMRRGTPILDAIRRQRGTPGSSSRGAAGGASTPLSAAGLRLAARVKAGKTPSSTAAGAGMGPQLRASYSRTPARSAASTPAATTAAAALVELSAAVAAPLMMPLRQPERVVRSADQATQAAAEPQAVATSKQGNITDGLLRLQ